MSDEKTQGVLLKGAGGHYFIPQGELAQFAVPGNPDPEGTVAASAQRVDAFAVSREPAAGEDEDAAAFVFAVEDESAQIFATEDESAEIFATEGDSDDGDSDDG